MGIENAYNSQLVNEYSIPFLNLGVNNFCLIKNYKQVNFCPFQHVISEGAHFFFPNQIPFHCTLTISSPARMDTRHLSVHSAHLAGENAAEWKTKAGTGSGKRTGKTLKL